MKMIHAALAGALVTCPPHALAQIPVAAQPPVAAIVSPSQDNVLRTGAKVPLKLAEPLTTQKKQLRVGQRFQLEVAEPVLLNGQVVISAGAPAVGEITEVRNKGMWGKSGHFTGQVLYVTVGNRQVRLNGTFDEKGSSGGVAAAAVSAVVFLPAGFFMTGKSASLPVGAPVTAFVGEDVQVAFAAAPSKPLVVPGGPAIAPVIAPVAAPAPGNPIQIPTPAKK